MVSILDNVLNDAFGPVLQSGIPVQDAVQVKVQGKVYDGWTTVSIAKSINSLSPSFTLNVADRWRQSSEKFPIMPGNQVKIGLFNIDPSTPPIITGHLEQFNATVSNEDRSIVVSGRSKTGDLIDSAAIGVNSTYKDVTLQEVATVYAQDFDIKVIDETPEANTKIKKVVVNQGETVFELLDRLAKERGVLLTSDGRGDLVITSREAQQQTPLGASPLAQGVKAAIGVTSGLFQGQNVLFAESTFDETDRFQKYLVKSQIQGDDFVNAKDAATINGVAFDPLVLRQRTKYIMAEKSSDNASAKERATWEANQAAAKSAIARVTVQGWNDQAGNLWDVNKLVDTDLTFIGFTKGQYLITDVNLVQAKSRGTLAILGLGRADSFSKQEPQKDNEPKRDSGWDATIFGSTLEQVSKNLGF